MKNKFKIGDLVQLKPFCKDRNRFAIVISIEHSDAFITFTDTGEQVRSYINNLVLINENR